LSLDQATEQEPQVHFGVFGQLARLEQLVLDGRSVGDWFITKEVETELASFTHQLGQFCASSFAGDTTITFTTFELSELTSAAIEDSQTTTGNGNIKLILL
jgi:hypothetical protein